MITAQVIQFRPMELFRPEDIELLLEDRIESATQVITALFEQGIPLTVAHSAGKDSSTVASLILIAARSFAAAGGTPMVIVSSSDTMVENPEITRLMRADHQKMEVYAAQHGIRLITEIVTPALISTFQVKILSGRGLPSFANTSSDCTTDLKIIGQRAFRKQLFRDLESEGLPETVTCLGTRFDESQRRSANMRQRGDRAETAVRNKDGDLVLSPIAYWDTEAVMEYLGYCSSGLIESYSNFTETLRVYAHSAGTSCAVVADSINEGRAKKGGCGARHGCYICQKSVDKSLENMIEFDERYAYARGLNRLNKYIRGTQNRWDMRHWVGRTIKEGYVAIEPDTYHPTMVRRLTRFMLQLDQDEWIRARRAGEERKFCILPVEMMIAIDAMQSLNGIALPFSVWADYRDITERGIRYDIPDVEPTAITPIPHARFLFVGKEWDDSASDADWTGLRDPYFEALTEGSYCSPKIRLLNDGKAVWDMETSQSFSVDSESAAMIVDFEMDQMLSMHDNDRILGGITSGYKFYAQFGCLNLSHSQVAAHDEVLRRTAFKDRIGLTLDYDIGQLQKKAIPFSEMTPAARQAWANKATSSSSQVDLFAA